MNKSAVLILGAVALAVVAFVAGAMLAPRIPFLAGSTNAVAGRTGGPMANLTDEERQRLQSMSDEERQQFLQERFGGQLPQGGPGGAAGRGSRTLLVEGEVMDVAADSLTVKTTNQGSQVVYYDAETITAYAKGVSETQFAKGMAVAIVAAPEAEQINSASLIVVK